MELNKKVTLMLHLITEHFTYNAFNNKIRNTYPKRINFRIDSYQGKPNQVFQFSAISILDTKLSSLKSRQKIKLWNQGFNFLHMLKSLLIDKFNEIYTHLKNEKCQDQLEENYKYFNIHYICRVK